MCVGTFAAPTAPCSGAAVAAKPAAMCKAATDLDLICSEDIGGKIRREYAPACLAAAARAATRRWSCCINELAKRDFPTLSDACLGCYTASVACTLAELPGACSVDANSAACVTCQTTKGCLSAFFTCSGLPGGPTGPDGGADTAPDTGGTTDAAASTPPVDAPRHGRGHRDRHRQRRVTRAWALAAVCGGVLAAAGRRARAGTTPRCCTPPATWAWAARPSASSRIPRRCSTTPPAWGTSRGSRRWGTSRCCWRT